MAEKPSDMKTPVTAEENVTTKQDKRTAEITAHKEEQPARARVTFTKKNETREYNTTEPTTTIKQHNTEHATPMNHPSTHQGTTGHHTPTQTHTNPPEHETTGTGPTLKKQTFRIEFLRVNTIGAAFQKWSKLMSYLRDVDPTMIIYNNQDPTRNLLPNEKIPTGKETSPYATMKDFQNRKGHQAKFACVTTIEMAQSMAQHKRDNALFIPMLMTLHVYIRPTELKTADTVEVGFFVGMHPSLTNIQWRTKHIQTQLKARGAEITLQLYPRKLTEGAISTSVIVVRCPKPDSQLAVTQLTTLHPGALGKQVEFIPYSIIRRTANNSLRNIFSLQNQYIADVGAIYIQGIPMETMEFEYGKTKQPFHQWLLESKHVYSVEHSDTPNKHKWWILTHKDTMGPLNKHLTTTVKDIMGRIHPNPEEYEVQPTESDRLEADPLNQPLTSLMDRLEKRIPAEEIKHPNPTGRARYAEIAKRHNNSIRPSSTLDIPLPALTQVTESTASSSLTNTSNIQEKMITQMTATQQTHTKELLENQKLQFDTIMAKQDRQISQMVEQFQKAMKDMMATMIKQIMEMMANIIQQRQPPSTAPSHPADHPSPQNHYPQTTYFRNPPPEHFLSTQARNLHQKINNFRQPSGRGGGRGSGRGHHSVEEGEQRRNLPKRILRQQEDNTPEINYDDENFWEQTYDSNLESQEGRYGTNNRSEATGGYPSTVAPIG